jgi:SNF family Na+-dependent transporter
MLPGANIGIDYFIKPDFSKLANYGVWVDAASKKNYKNPINL